MGGARQSEKEEVISMSKKRSSNADIRKQVRKSGRTVRRADRAISRAERKNRKK